MHIANWDMLKVLLLILAANCISTLAFAESFDCDNIPLPGRLAIYGARFGRYPLDPTLTFVLKN